MENDNFFYTNLFILIQTFIKSHSLIPVASNLADVQFSIFGIL